MGLIPHRARLLVDVSAVSLSARLQACGGKEPPVLCFSGRVRAEDTDFRTPVSTLAERLAGHAIHIRCLSTTGNDGGEKPAAAIGWCQMCPIAGDLGLTVDVHCCAKRFGVLRSTVQFGYATPRAELTLTLDVLEESEAAGCGECAVARLPVIGLSLDVALSFAAPGEPACVPRTGPAVSAPVLDVATW